MLRAILAGCLLASTVGAQTPQGDVQPDTHVDGTIRSIPGVRLLLDADDGRLLAIVLDDSTRFAMPRNELRVGARVRVQTKRNGRGTLVAVEVLEAGAPVAPPEPPSRRTPAAVPAKGGAPERVLTQPDTGPPPEEEELPRPVLRRRKAGDAKDLEYVEDPDFGEEVRKAAKEQKKAAEEQGVLGAVEPVFSPESLHEDPLIGKAILASHDFMQSIPDFIAEQHVERFRSGNNGRNWKKHDAVTMDVLFAGGKEFYQNVKLNGGRAR